MYFYLEKWKRTEERKKEKERDNYCCVFKNHKTYASLLRKKRTEK